eukprot:197389_1
MSNDPFIVGCVLCILFVSFIYIVVYVKNIKNEKNDFISENSRLLRNVNALKQTIRDNQNLYNKEKQALNEKIQQLQKMLCQIHDVNKVNKSNECSSHSNVSDTDTSYSSVSSEYSDSESWRSYTETIKQLFPYFCISDSNKQFMNANELEQFLQIVGITKYWNVRQVEIEMICSENTIFKVKHSKDRDIVCGFVHQSQLLFDSDNSYFIIPDLVIHIILFYLSIDGKQVTLNAFVAYFCDPKSNPKAKDIKKFILKQVQWGLLMKTLELMELCDNDHDGKLNYNDFKMLGNQLSLNERETKRLFDTIIDKGDYDYEGKVTINGLFRWFKAKNQTISRQWSESHSSFYYSDSSAD